MKYILDTHVVLWVAENSSMLSEKVKAVILDEGTEKYVSLASAWEVAIKLHTNRLTIHGGLSEFFRMIDDNGFFTLSVERDHISHLARLPDHHRDPFDRLLVATAISENATLITIDAKIHQYNVSHLW